MVDHLHTRQAVPLPYVVRDCHMRVGSPAQPTAGEGKNKLHQCAHGASIRLDTPAAFPVSLVSERFRANAASSLVQEQAIRTNRLIAMVLDDERLSCQGGECHRRYCRPRDEHYVGGTD